MYGASITVVPTSTSSTSASIKLGGETVSSTGDKASDGTFEINTATAETTVEGKYAESADPVIKAIKKLKTAADESSEPTLVSVATCNAELNVIAEARTAYAGLSAGAKAEVAKENDIDNLIKTVTVETGEDGVIKYLDARKAAVTAIKDAASELELVTKDDLEVTDLEYAQSTSGTTEENLATDKTAAETALKSALGTIIGTMTFENCTNVAVKAVSINDDFTAETDVDGGTYTCTVTLTCDEKAVYELTGVSVTNGTLQ